MINNIGYKVIPGLITKDAALITAANLEILRINILTSANLPLDSTTAWNDPDVKEAFAWYASYATESLLLYLRPQVEKIVGKNLWPSYSYARIYWPGSELSKHTDRPSCEYSVTITLEDDGNEDWPIWFQHQDGTSVPLVLKEGDGCVYQGCVMPHWREPYKGKRQTQAFLHYVDADGPYANFKFDKRQFVGLPKVNDEG